LIVVDFLTRTNPTWPGNTAGWGSGLGAFQGQCHPTKQTSSRRFLPRGNR